MIKGVRTEESRGKKLQRLNSEWKAPIEIQNQKNYAILEFISMKQGEVGRVIKTIIMPEPVYNETDRGRKTYMFKS